MESKKAQKEFTENFHTLAKDLSPIIAKFLVDNNITLKPSLYFFASLIVELLNKIEDEAERESMMKVLLLFMSGDKYGEI